jgi:hypothetical protein
VSGASHQRCRRNMRLLYPRGRVAPADFRPTIRRR